jgi:hypothetical protein
MVFTPSVVTSGLNYNQISYSENSGVWNQISTVYSASGVPSTQYSVPVTPPTFAACYAPSESLSDGMSIGWALAAVMASVYFVILFRQIGYV